MNREILLDVKRLKTEFAQEKGKSVVAVNDITFQILKGEVVGLVGESGCGKSVTSLSVMQLLKDTPGKVTEGEIILEGVDLLKCNKAEMRKIRGKKISMIFQEPMSSLNPVMRIETQMIETIRLHMDVTKEEAYKHAEAMLDKVGIPDTKRVLRNFPHQLSGGMSQRVMIAMAMSCSPHLLIADEPTTALDVTIQAQILDLMRKISSEEETGILLITHDLGIVAEMCTRVMVMYAGRVVEQATVNDLFAKPMHPYTIGLISSVPKLGSGITKLPSIPGSVPDLSMMPEGCKFAPRCKFAMDICKTEEPSLVEIDNTRKCRCWLHERKGEVS